MQLLGESSSMGSSCLKSKTLLLLGRIPLGDMPPALQHLQIPRSRHILCKCLEKLCLESSRLLLPEAVILGWMNLRGMAWKWVSFLKTKCPVIPLSLSAHTPIFLLSLHPLSFLSIFLFTLCTESSFPEGCPPQGMCDFWGTKPTDTSYSQRAGLPGVALWVTQDSGSRGWPEALMDVPEHSDWIWQAASVIWRNSQREFCSS